MRWRGLLAVAVSGALVAGCTASDDPASTVPASAPVGAPTSTTAGEVAAEAPALDRSSVAALGAVVVRHPSITAGDEVLVEFRNDAQSIAVSATALFDTAVTVLAPPLLDAATGVPVAGTVEISLEGGPTTTLVIDEPPDALAGPPGSVTRSVLEQAAADLEVAETAIGAVSSATGLDLAAAVAATQTVAGDLARELEWFDETGSFMVTGVPDGPLTFTTEQLEVMDRMVTAYLLGVLDWLGSGVEMAPAGFAGVAAGAPPGPWSIEQLLAELRTAKSQVENGGKVLVGSLAMLVTIAGAYGSSALFAFLAGTAAAATLGVAAEGFAALEAWATGGRYEFGEAFSQALLNAFLSLGVAIGGELSVVVNLASFLHTRSEVAAALSALVCDVPEVAPEYRAWCDERRLGIAAPLPIAVPSVWFTPDRIAPGVQGELVLYIRRGPTHDAIVDIDWTGDGPTADDTTFDAEDGVIKLDHAFSTVEARVYTIHVSAIDANGVEATGKTKVFVGDDARLGIEATGLPTRMLTGDTNTWEFEILNGYAEQLNGYNVVVDFGDGTPAKNGWRRTRGTFTVDHKYLEAGDYTVRASVTDRTDTAAITLTASVREPVRIAGIDGPPELEAQTDGAFTVQIEDGWPPYQVEIDWGDGSELLRQQSEGSVSASHRYPEQPQEETYTITAFVEDAVPLGSEATKTVVVPGPLIVLGISNDATHDGQVLVNIEGVNRTQEATDRGVTSGPWVATHRGESQSPGGRVTIDPTTGVVTVELTETWSCVDECLQHADYFDVSWAATGTASWVADGVGWRVDVPLTVEYSARRGSAESASDCGGSPCYTCADQYCRWDNTATAAAVQLTGRIEGSTVRMAFVDGLAEDVTTMDFSGRWTTEFFLSRFAHEWSLPKPVPPPG